MVILLPLLFEKGISFGCDFITASEVDCKIEMNSSVLPQSYELHELSVCVWSTAEQVITEMSGPSRSEQWLYWKSQAMDQKNRLAAIRELEKLLQSDVVCIHSNIVPCCLFIYYPKIVCFAFSGLQNKPLLRRVEI